MEGLFDDHCFRTAVRLAHNQDVAQLPVRYVSRRGTIRQLAVLLVQEPHYPALPASTSRVSLPFYKLLSLQSSAELIRCSISAIFSEMAETTPSWAWCIQAAKRGQVFDSLAGYRRSQVEKASSQIKWFFALNRKLGFCYNKTDSRHVGSRKGLLVDYDESRAVFVALSKEHRRWPHAGSCCWGNL